MKIEQVILDKNEILGLGADSLMYIWKEHEARWDLLKCDESCKDMAVEEQEWQSMTLRKS